MKLAELKQKHGEELTELVEKLKLDFIETKEGKEYKQAIFSFTEDPYRNNNLYFDDSGLLSASEYIPAPNIDIEILESLWSDLDVFSNTKDIISICLGEAVIFNLKPERNCYAIYSDELGLKVHSVSSHEEGIKIIEEAMNNHGCFSPIVSCDRYGNVSLIK